LPTSDIGHTSSVGPALGRLIRYQRQELDRLAEAHVVGQDTAETEITEEREPRKAPFLVRPQLAGEARRSAHGPQPPVSLTGQQVAQPAVGVHADQGDVGVRAAQAGRQRVGRGHRPGLVALEELQRGRQVRLVELNPLAAQPDQRDLQPGQLGQLGRIERLIADGDVVPEVHQVTQAELRSGDRGGGLGLGPGGQLQPEARLAHPVGQQHTEPGAGQQRTGLRKEPERARRVQVHRGGCRLAQRVLDLAEQPGGGAEPGQQLLHRIFARRARQASGNPGPAAEPRPEASTVARPHVRGRDHEAGVIGGLQRELNPPGISFRCARLDEPEAGPDRTCRYLRAVQPGVELGGQLPALRLVLRAPHVDASVGCGQGRHEPFGHRQPSRSTAAPGGQEGGRQPAARRGIGERLERVGQQQPWRLPGRCPAGRGHRRRQVVTPLRIGAAEHRPPPGGVRPVFGGQDRQHPPAHGQVSGEPGHRGQVGQRSARGGLAITEAADPAEHVQRGRGLEGEHGHPPAGQRYPADRPAPGRAGGLVIRLGQFGGGERPVTGRRQLQRQLVADRLAGGVGGRTPQTGQPGEQVSQLGGLARERVRPGEP
jgi:hypothetical protein